MCRNALESPLSSKLPPELGPTTRATKSSRTVCSPLSSPSLRIVFVFAARDLLLLLLPPLLLLVQNNNCVPLLIVSCVFFFFFLVNKGKKKFPQVQEEWSMIKHNKLLLLEPWTSSAMILVIMSLHSRSILFLASNLHWRSCCSLDNGTLLQPADTMIIIFRTWEVFSLCCIPWSRDRASCVHIVIHCNSGRVCRREGVHWIAAGFCKELWSLHLTVFARVLEQDHHGRCGVVAGVPGLHLHFVSRCRHDDLFRSAATAAAAFLLSHPRFDSGASKPCGCIWWSAVGVAQRQLSTSSSRWALWQFGSCCFRDHAQLVASAGTVLLLAQRHARSTAINLHASFQFHTVGLHAEPFAARGTASFVSSSAAATTTSFAADSASGCSADQWRNNRSSGSWVELHRLAKIQSN